MNGVVPLALRNLARNTRRTVIATGVVAFGVAALIVAGGFVDSLLVKLREDTIHSRLGHIQIQRPKFAELGLSAPYAHLLPLTRESFEPIARLPGVQSVTPRLALGGLISIGETTLSFTGHGVDPAGESAFARGIDIRSGSSLQPGDTDAVVLGEGLAANLGVKPGDTVALLVTTASGSFNAGDFNVRGTFSSISKAYDDIALRLPIAAAQRLLRIQGAQQWLVLLADTAATQSTVQRIRVTLPPNAYAVTTWEDDADFYRKTAELFARQFGFVRVVIGIVIVLSILNTMTMSVLERTWEIGVMLAVGDSRAQILALFACEGVLLGMIGGALGALGGILLAVALDAVGIPMPPPPGMSHGFDAGVSISVLLVVAAFAIGTAATALAAMPPSIRASRMPIVDALRASR
jgi:putative ABC transport system permease protein